MTDVNHTNDKRQKLIPFSDLVKDVSGGNRKVPTSACITDGVLPVIDQGKRKISGYTDDLANSFRSAELPVVIFGDHTKSVKYVDHPFAMGADGVKVLKPSDKCDARFFYHYLKQARIPDAGYSRHFKFVKRLCVPLPPLPEQRRIAAILDKADALRQKRREAIAKLDQLLQSVFLEMFGDPVTNPLDWPLVALVDICDSDDRINYGVVQPGTEFEGGKPLIRVGDFVAGEVRVDDVKKIAPEIESAYKRSRLKGNELLVSCVGSIGVVAEVPESAIGWNIARAVTRVPLVHSNHRAFYREALRTDSVQRFFKQKTRTVSQPTLNVGFVKETLVYQPPVELIELFCRVARSVSALKKECAQAHNKERELQLSLQQRAFTGQL